MRRDSLFRRFEWSEPEYAEAFATLLRCSRERPQFHNFLRALISEYPRESVALDWGAGSGDLTELLCERFDRVLAVEPSLSMRRELMRKLPHIELIEGDLFTAQPPVLADVALMSHVLYHVPSEEWPSAVINAARRLSPQGVLVVVMKHALSGCNRMLQTFGAKPFDLIGSLVDAIREHPEFEFCFRHLPGGVVTSSFEETLSIARFMLCDRKTEAFVSPPTEAEFQEYVREKFWNEDAGSGGWNYHLVLCLIRPNQPFFQK